MAVSGVGDEIFNRTKIEAGYDSDFLDDTALITAFDNAINPIKAMLGDTQLTDVAANKSRNKPPNKKKHKKNKSKKNKNNSDSLVKWHVGSQCRCVFGDDGLTYDAVIVSLDSDADTCTVRYSYYDNEEEQLLSNLLPPTAASQHSASMASDIESVDGLESPRSSRQNNDFKIPHPRQSQTNRKSSGNATPRPMPNFMQPPFPFHHNFPSFPHMPPTIPHMPPLFPHMPRHMPSFQQMPGIPLIPPPPPPPLSCDDDKEALYNMLISWYMSGYHTGYYEGLKRSHRHSEDVDTDSTSTCASSSVKNHR